jgi:hypothetical protein
MEQQIDRWPPIRLRHLLLLNLAYSLVLMMDLRDMAPQGIAKTLLEQ